MIIKSFIALGTVAILSTSAFAGPAARGHVKVFDGARGTTAAQSTTFVNPTQPTGFRGAKLFVRKTGSQSEH